MATHPAAMPHSQNLISAVVVAEARRPTAWSLVEVHTESLFGQILYDLTSQAETEVQVIAVDDPYMEVVSYADLNPPVVLLGIGHLRRLYDISQLFELDLPDEAIVSDLSKHVILGSLADCFLLRGNEELAVRSYVLSIVGGSKFVGPKSLDGLFKEEISLGELLLQYYGLAHEIGHCARSRISVDPARLDGQLEAALADCIEGVKRDPSYSANEDRATAVAERMKKFYQSGVGRTDIQEEVSADLFAIECLWRLGARGWRNEFSHLNSFVREFAQRLFICMNGISVSERLQQFARLAAQSAQPAHLAPDDWFAYLLTSQATKIRIHVAFAFLAYLIGRDIADSEAGPTDYPDWKDFILSVVGEYENLVGRLDNGLTQARQTLFDLGSDTFEMIAYMRHYHEMDKRLRWQTETFIERVRERIPASDHFVSALADTLHKRSLCQEGGTGLS
jgi:hypothetical protein